VFPVWRLRGRISLAVANISGRNNILAIYGGLIVSPDMENKFEICSCEERGVKRHRH
jgi:hypothetical protein